MSQGIANLYRTGLSTTDPNFLPSAGSRSDYQAQTGLQAANHDPSKPNKFWWDPAAATLPPTQSITYQAWNGSLTQPALVPLTLTAAEAAAVNIPGDMTYSPFVLPDATGVTWASNAQFTPTPLPANSLCTLADAQRLASMIPGSKIISGQQQFPNGTFLLNGQAYPASAAAQPWWIVLPTGVGGFAGVAVQAMDEPHGKGAPCRWVANASGYYDLVFDLPSDSESSSTMAIPCNAVPAGFYLASVVNGLIPTVEILPVGNAGITITISGPLAAGVYSIGPVSSGN